MGTSDIAKVGGGNPAPTDANIVICDDDAQLRGLLASFLGGQGYSVATVGDGRELVHHLRGAAMVDLVILDIMLPGQSGIEICRDIRATSSVPIMMLTARGDETDRITGLETGADDYVSKPFSPNELLARIKALLRRARMSTGGDRLQQRRAYEFDGWRLDLLRRELRDSTAVIIDLSVGEFDLLVAFLEAPQRILSRDFLLEATRSREANSFDRSIDVQVSRLRRKLGTSDDGEGFIKTVRGSGYMFLPSVVRR